jgi:4-amino-4-deoxy-L-arabinose transferase-like glycosyltransferase
MDAPRALPQASRSLTLPGLGATLELPVSRALLTEAAVLVGLLALIFATYSYRLASVVVPNMDEGTYLYASKLIAQGEVPYRDFYLAHPPLLMYFFAAPFKLFGADVMEARYIYMAVVLLSAVPLYLMVRNLWQNRWAALLSVPVYTTGMLFIANTGRTIRLEPFMNALIIPALALYFWRPDNIRLRVIIGVLLAAAAFVKPVAVLAIALLFVGDLLWRREERRFLLSWAAMAVGALIVMAGVAALLRGGDGFVDAAVRSHLERGGIPLELRMENFVSANARFPAIPIALLASLWLLVRGQDPRLRIMALLAVGQAALILLAFRSSINYYYIQVLPQVAVIFSLIAVAITAQVFRRAWQPLVIAGVFFLAGVAPLVYAQVYYQRRDLHTSSPAAVVRELKGEDGYLYSMFPNFSLASGVDLYPWRYAIDSYLPRTNGDIGDTDFVRVLMGSEAAVFWRGELEPWPKTQAYLTEHFKPVYEDAYWELWVREGAAAGASGG